jgi:polysaccharide chain length determinant protein (PEP-CTERM system associated)
VDPHILQYVKVILTRLHSKALVVGLAIAVISFTMLGFGMMHNPKYETSITIYSDNSNVIKPLLEGQATVTMPRTERTRIVRETMFSHRVLDDVITLAFPDFILGDRQEAERLMAQLRAKVKVSAPANNYVQITYANEEPQVSYKVVNKLTSLFIEESAQNKRAESRSAFNFIDEQVKTYKSQLVEAENKLKSFEASNIDGLESQVNASIARLRVAIDELTINIEAEEVRIAALEVQLSNEGRFASNDYNARVYRDRLAQLELMLDTMTLNLRAQHPDVVDLKLQIQDLKRTIVEVENAKTAGMAENDLTGENRTNPIYEELSGKLSAAAVNVQTMRHRFSAYENRMKEQYERRVRVASNQADLSELTRDYSVTKQIYEDLLARKEKARITMTLDLTGQGVSYKILEPAAFPVLPTGIRFRHFALAGPPLGLIVVLGLFGASILFDNRVLFVEQLDDAFPGIVLGVFPSTESKDSKFRVAGFAVGFLATYSLAAFSFAIYV